MKSALIIVAALCLLVALVWGIAGALFSKRPHVALLVAAGLAATSTALSTLSMMLR